jgi:hypothetical protein
MDIWIRVIMLSLVIIFFLSVLIISFTVATHGENVGAFWRGVNVSFANWFSGLVGKIPLPFVR